MNRPLYIDLDNTIFNSAKAFLQAYNVMFEDTGKEETLCWNFSDCNVDPTKIRTVFDSSLFITYLKPYYGALDVIKALSSETDVSIVTIGTYENIKHKIWLFECLGLTKYCGMIPIIKPENKDIVMNKEIISGRGVLVDDHPRNLKTSTIDKKVMFSYRDKPYDWQKDYNTQYKITNWDKKAYKLLLKLIKED